MSEWQPIETAPKDGTEILVWAKEGRRCARWVPGNHRHKQGWADWIEDADEDYLSEIVYLHPTDWMPLPDPPTSSESTG